MVAWRHLVTSVETSKGRENNGKLPLRTCLERKVPETYRSTDWAVVFAKQAQKLNTNTNKNIHENQQIHQLFIQFINYVW
jgi:hypothetical protein